MQKYPQAFCLRLQRSKRNKPQLKLTSAFPPPSSFSAISSQYKYIILFVFTVKGKISNEEQRALSAVHCSVQTLINLQILQN